MCQISVEPVAPGLPNSRLHADIAVVTWEACMTRLQRQSRLRGLPCADYGAGLVLKRADSRSWTNINKATHNKRLRVRRGAEPLLVALGVGNVGGDKLPSALSDRKSSYRSVRWRTDPQGTQSYSRLQSLGDRAHVPLAPRPKLTSHNSGCPDRARLAVSGSVDRAGGCALGPLASAGALLTPRSLGRCRAPEFESREQDWQRGRVWG